MIVFRTLLAIIRLILFFLVTLIIYSSILFTNLIYKNKAKKITQGIVLRRLIIRISHYILGSKITVYGKAPAQSGLIISNHRSYFDSLVILKNILAYPIAKIEVASWPLIGSVCKSTGVIFIDRENNPDKEKILNDQASCRISAPSC